MRIIYLISLFLCISCSKKDGQSNDIAVHRPDQIEYYYLNIGDDQLREIFNSENMSRHERQLAEILHHIAPEVVSDTTFVAQIEEMPFFSKTDIPAKANDEILAAFASDNMHSASFVNSIETCAPTFRDILIFRQRNKIVGFAKVCFECRQTHFVGSRFGSVHTDYDGLGKILKQFTRK